MTPQQVIRSYLTIAGIYTFSASLIWGVNTLFLLDAGLDIAEVFIANAFFTAGMVIFEIPTGVVADTAGRRISFLLSVIVLALATIGYVLVGQAQAGIVWFAGMSILLGLGFTFYSGAVEAWLVDALDATGFDGELDHVFARGSMVTGVAMLIGSVGGGFIGTVDLAIPFIGRALLLLIAFGFAFRNMQELGYQPKPLQLNKIPRQMARLTQASVQYGWREPHLRLMMMVSFIQAGFMAWAFYAWQPYFLDLFGDPEAVWIAGIIMALLSISTILGNMFVEWYTRHDGKRTTLLIGGMAIFALSMIGVGVTSNFYLAAGLLLIGTTMLGVMGPVRQSFIHHLIPSEQRATVVSVDSMVSSGGGMITQTGLGQVALRQSISAGYVIGGLATTLTLPLLMRLRSLGSPADVIVGDAGHTGAHAAQGLPAVTSIDAKPCEEIPFEPAAD